MFRLQKTFLSILLEDKLSIKFLLGVIIGLSFSIAVILSTVGIMDGFEWSIKRVLKRAVGDIYFYSRDGFFTLSGRVKKDLQAVEVQNYSAFVQTEGFLIHQDVSKGVLIRGIEENSFSQVTGIKLTLGVRDVALGSELIKFLEVKIGDEIVLAFANGNKDFSGLPLLRRFRIKDVVHHGIYQKDMRQIYVKRESLQSALNIDEKINVIALNAPIVIAGADIKENQALYGENILLFMSLLKRRIGDEFVVRHFWNDFTSLFKAVRVEKWMVGLILYLVVIISIFNVLAFVIFINEKRSRELFLFKAVGMSQEMILKGWLILIFIIWGLSSLLSIFLVKLLGLGLTHLSFLQMPGDVYYLGRFTIILGSMDYVVVFLVTLLWLLLISWVGLKRVRKSPILQGLRQEFA